MERLKSERAAAVNVRSKQEETRYSLKGAPQEAGARMWLNWRECSMKGRKHLVYSEKV